MSIARTAIDSSIFFITEERSTLRVLLINSGGQMKAFRDRTNAFLSGILILSGGD